MSIEISEKNVAAYLTANPDFFQDRDKLLLKMQLPHNKKGAVSLVEKQVALMQERQRKTKKQLNEFITSAKRNKEIFDKSSSLILDLISASRSADFFAALEKGLKRDFQCKAYSLVVFGKRPRQINHFTSRVNADSARDYVGALMRAKKPTLGVLRSAEQDFLFRHQSEKVKSAAVLAVRARNKQIALLAIGSADAHYFSADQDTVFIAFIADTLAKLLPRHLPK